MKLASQRVSPVRARHGRTRDGPNTRDGRVRRAMHANVDSMCTHGRPLRRCAVGAWFAGAEAAADERVSAAEAQARHAIEATLLEKGEATLAAHVTWQAAADEALAAVEASWSARLAAAADDADAARAALNDERDAFVAERDASLSQLEAAREATARELADGALELTALRDGLDEATAQLADAMPLLQHAAAEGAVARAQEAMASSDGAATSAR
jgi:hypothetical protein